MNSVDIVVKDMYSFMEKPYHPTSMFGKTVLDIKLCPDYTTAITPEIRDEFYNLMNIFYYESADIIQRLSILIGELKNKKVFRFIVFVWVFIFVFIFVFFLLLLYSLF